MRPHELVFIEGDRIAGSAIAERVAGQPDGLVTLRRCLTPHED